MYIMIKTTVNHEGQSSTVRGRVRATIFVSGLCPL
jgi:hypothetical protein